MSDERKGPPLRVLGPMHLEIDGVSEPVGGPLARRLLAALVVNRNRVVHVERLMDMLWGPVLPATALPTLRSHLSRLRTRLPPTVVLQAVPPGYRLLIPGDGTDAERFERAVAAAEERSDDGARALEQLDAARALWRGPFLAEFADEDWVRPEAARLEERYLRASELRVEALLAVGHVDTAVAEARLLATAHPTREAAWTVLVRALHAAGRRREALATAHGYRRRLREESGLSPSAEFAALERQVATEPAAATPSTGVPSSAGRSPVGARGLTSPAPGGVGRNVPEPWTRFYGRCTEAEQVAELLRTERCVTLLGAGGMGKTRLALHAATAVDLPDGTWFAALAEVADDRSDAVPYAVAESLGIRPEPGAGIADTVAEWIGQRRALLLLDNCEHLATGVAQLVTLLLSHCRGLTVLATSRDPLHLPGEARLMVGPLDPESARALFVDRVHAYDPAAPAALDARDVADLCDRLGRIPLAIELAAARCRATSPRELAARLEDRPHLLSDPSRPPAQQTLTTVLDWSVDRLPASARHVFARLSVFHGGCRLDQAEAIVSGDGMDGADVLDALQHLTDAGPVDVIRSGPTVRYVQLEPIRQHGERLLDASQRAELGSRHCAVFAQLAEEIGRGLCGPDFAHWVRVPEGDMANLRAAFGWALNNGRIDLALDVVSGLRRYLNEHLTMELCDWGDAIVKLARGRGDAMEARALAVAATGWLFQRRYEEIYRSSERVRAMSEVDADAVALLAWADGWARVNSGDHHGAAPIWLGALRSRPSPWNEALLSASLVVCGRQPPDLDEILDRVASPSLRIWHQIWAAKIVGSPERLVATDSMLAGVVEQTAQLGATHARGVALYIRAFVLAQLPDRPPAEVLAVIDEAITLWSDLSVPSQMLVPVLEALGFTLALRGFPEQACTLFAVVEARGGTLWRNFRSLVEGPLAELAEPARRASRDRATQFTGLAEVAQFARSLIRVVSETSPA